MIRLLTLIGLIVIMTLVYTVGHGAGADAGYDLAQAETDQRYDQAKDAWDRTMADAYMDAAVLRDRLTLTQRQLQEARSLLAGEHERAEQASAERDRARSRLGLYERSTWEPPLILQ